MTGFAPDQPAQDPVSAPPPATSNVFQRIAGVLFAPAQTFEEIARKPDVLMPLLVFLVIGLVTTAVIIPRLDFESIIAQQSEVMKKRNPNMGEDDMERIARFTRASGTVMGWLGPLLQVGMYAIVAGVLLLAFRLFGGEGTYKQAFSATMYAWIPKAIQGIIMAIVVAVQGRFDPVAAATIVKSNPAFLADMNEQPVMFALLASLDVFTIWSLVLFVFGFAALSRMSKGRSAALIVSLWVSWLVVKLGMAALSASRMKA